MKHSVVMRTGQTWKLVLSILLMLIGSFAPLWDVFGMSWTVGTVLALVGYAFGCLAITCPDCGSRWFWSAALDAGLYGPLFRSSACRACTKDFGPGRT